MNVSPGLDLARREFWELTSEHQLKRLRKRLLCWLPAYTTKERAREK